MPADDTLEAQTDKPSSDTENEPQEASNEATEVADGETSQTEQKEA